ncbi:MAG TPA: SDR family oxidoreductase [Thermoanaerobaculia bacterium]|jgi:NAD(P)-dependent dehydrogenase (short-subunit alcohol dehydrogenase family)|nr:SDR family oxidoreductase [Thermoanaerobaculia bacterium]
MKIQDRVAIVTGGASGIGRAVAERFKSDGARHVVVADRDEKGARAVAEKIGGTGIGLDVAHEGSVRALVDRVQREQGSIDLFFSNAGYGSVGGLEAPNEEFQRMWEVHVMAHVYASRAVLPQMIKRGEGYLLSTASAAGLLSQIGSVSYAVTKHAAVALAEWLAITHGAQGIRVSVLCPQAVATNIRANSPQRDRMGTTPGVASGDGVLSPEQVADSVMEAIDRERFWVLPHPQVGEYVRRKATDVDRWLHGMQRFQQRLYEGQTPPGEWILPKDEAGS